MWAIAERDLAPDAEAANQGATSPATAAICLERPAVIELAFFMACYEVDRRAEQIALVVSGGDAPT
jgi:hypothetical protein